MDEKTMKEYDREVCRRVWRMRARRVDNYIEGHAWAQWVIAAAMVLAFCLAVDVGYSSLHGGRSCVDDLLTWAGCPQVEEVAK